MTVPHPGTAPGFAVNPCESPLWTACPAPAEYVKTLNWRALLRISAIVKNS
jgi:hypothetical protein